MHVGIAPDQTALDRQTLCVSPLSLKPKLQEKFAKLFSKVLSNRTSPFLRVPG